MGVENLPPAFIYDYKQLKFFNIDPKQVEHRGTIINMPPRERYGWIFILAYSVVLVVLVMLIAWLVRANRRESRHRLHAQTRLLVQDKLVEQRDEFDNIVNSVTGGLITYDTDLRIHFVNNSLRRMLGLNATPEWERAYEGKMAGSIFEIYVNGENVSVRITRGCSHPKCCHNSRQCLHEGERNGQLFHGVGRGGPHLCRRQADGNGVRMPQHFGDGNAEESLRHGDRGERDLSVALRP